jgi:hypothetical protein
MCRRSDLKDALTIAIGIVIGATAMLLFSKSLPPEEGSVEAELEIVEQELGEARQRIRAMEDDRGITRGFGGRPRRTVGDGVRSIAQDMRDGKEVSVDDVFATMKPWMRDMAPLFNRMREINHEDWADEMVGEWSRKYDLDDEEKKELREWFMEKNRERSEELEHVLSLDSSGFVEWVRAMEYDVQDSEGLDEVMEGFLEGDELQSFRDERLAERTERVFEEANRGLARLDSVVGLDDTQRDGVYDVLVRGAPGYVDGGTAETAALDRYDRDLAVRDQLRPEQIEALDAHREERRLKAEKDLRRMGLTLPENWDHLEPDTF